MSKHTDVVGSLNLVSELAKQAQAHSNLSADEAFRQIIAKIPEIFAEKESKNDPLISARAKAIPNWEEQNKLSAYDGVELTREELIALYDSGERNFVGVDLSGVNLFFVNLRGVNLSHADLSGVNLSHADLSGVNLSHAKLPHVNLFGAKLPHANLFSANLFSANLFSANLFGANLCSANLFSANLREVWIDNNTKVNSATDFRFAIIDSENPLVQQLLARSKPHDADSLALQQRIIASWQKIPVQQ